MINPKELLTDKLYFADEKYMSVSTFKRFKKCEIEALEPWGEPSDAMKVGSYVDSYVSGVLDEFIEEHPEIISSRGATKGELKSEFKKAEEICDYIDNNKLLQSFFSGDKQMVLTGEINGVPVKGKLDFYSKGIAINDLKVLRTVTDNNGEYYDFISPYGYDLQLAVYSELVRQNTGEILPCFICAVTKEKCINSVIVKIDQVFLDRALYVVESNIQRYEDLRRGRITPIGCGVCDSCISQRNSTPIISLADLIEGVV